MYLFLVNKALRRLLKIWVPSKPEEFIDLCTVANISIFILDDINHGYYIHGKIPGGVAEGIFAFVTSSLIAHCE